MLNKLDFKRANYFNNIKSYFPIDNYHIPRPLKSIFNTGISSKYDISDVECIFTALSYLGVPHDSFPSEILEPVGWLYGPHLLKSWSLLISEQRFLNQIQSYPSMVFHDSPMQLAITILKRIFEYGSPQESKQAKNILNKAGLSVFVKKGFSKKRSKNKSIRFYNNYPGLLVSAVSFYEFVVKKFLKSNYKRDEIPKRYKDIGKAYDYIYKNNIPETLIFRERDKETKAFQEWKEKNSS